MCLSSQLSAVWVLWSIVYASQEHNRYVPESRNEIACIYVPHCVITLTSLICSWLCLTCGFAALLCTYEWFRFERFDEHKLDWYAYTWWWINKWIYTQSIRQFNQKLPFYKQLVSSIEMQSVRASNQLRAVTRHLSSCATEIILMASLWIFIQSTFTECIITVQDYTSSTQREMPWT